MKPAQDVCAASKDMLDTVGRSIANRRTNVSNQVSPEIMGDTIGSEPAPRHFYLHLPLPGCPDT
ncbi:hypothetical protein N7508_008900 [Penicillium antarcticum]|nr:uncharacterized protein N7508_008900 [Penicillium antarcticum]KAJ5294079.1 hypothetical protein N7508_008900 [Penicillium antarcticum]